MGGYIDSLAAPLYAFGHGLSFLHRVRVLDLRLDTASAPADGTVALEATRYATPATGSAPRSSSLWVPEVGGPIDRESEAHDLVMSVFGSMSKGGIKIRVRTAMAAQAKIEGRYLGGRPPYGYRLVDAGPHPNPAKATDGKRLHRLDPVTARWSSGSSPSTWPVSGSSPSPSG
ncbi:hypothetical protein [Streptomyces asiaticus]|uniref:hypothetical protein n=1 Tax=Streptomyces asiaticus TaxID=114695 RepID=UPI003D70F668